MALQIIEATRVQSKARIGFAGPAGSGKTFTALTFAFVFGNHVCVIDSENSRSAKYANRFPKFSIIPLEERFGPDVYVEAIGMAESRGFDVIIIDSASHEWFGPGGELEMADTAARTRYRGNSWAGWNDVTDPHNRFIHAIVHCKAHLMITMRAKVETSMDRNPDTGRSEVRKLGMKAIQKEGLDYELDVYGDLDLEHNWKITKTIYSDLDNMTIRKPGREIAELILQELNTGEDPAVVAEKRFFIKYKKINTWEDVQGFVGNIPKPSTVEEWEMVDVLMSGYL